MSSVSLELPKRFFFIVSFSFLVLSSFPSQRPLKSYRHFWGKFHFSPQIFAHAQQAGPLEGQGIDPMSAGLRKSPLPVYMSVDLHKLVNVDQKEYNFAEVFTVVQAWQDPRAADISLVIAASAAEKRAAAAQRVAKCRADLKERSANDSSATPPTTTTGSSSSLHSSSSANSSSSSSCMGAADASDLLSGCTRTCVLMDAFVCCDNVWIPSFTLPNLLVLSQDRFVADGIYFPRPFDPSLVMRVTRVEGEFATTFNFASFPFDSQVLSVRIDSGNLGFFIAPSLVDRGFMSTSLSYWNMSRYGNFSLPYANETDPRLDGILPVQLPQIFQQQFPTDEVTDWRITGLELVCPPVPHRISLANSYVRGMNPLDPSMVPYQLSLNSTTRTENLSCTFNIQVSRLSSSYVPVLIIPTMLTVELSLTAFFARPADLDIRLSTAITLFLTLVAVQFVIDDQLPKTQYLTAFGYLVLISYFVICLVVIESIIVFHIHHYEEGFLRRRRLQKEEEERKRLRRAGLIGSRGRSAGSGGKRLLSGRSFLSHSLARPFSPTLSQLRVKESTGDSNRSTQLGERSSRLSEGESNDLSGRSFNLLHTSVREEPEDDLAAAGGLTTGDLGQSRDTVAQVQPRSGTAASGKRFFMNSGRDSADVATGTNEAGASASNSLVVNGGGEDQRVQTAKRLVRPLCDDATEVCVDVSVREEGGRECPRGGEQVALLEPEPPVPLLADRVFRSLVNSTDEAMWLAERLDFICFCVLFFGYLLAAILVFTLV